MARFIAQFNHDVPLSNGMEHGAVRVRPRNDPHFINRNSKDFSTQRSSYSLSRLVLCVVMHYLHWFEAKKTYRSSGATLFFRSPTATAAPFFKKKRYPVAQSDTVSRSATDLFFPSTPPCGAEQHRSRSATDHNFFTSSRGTERHRSLGPRRKFLFFNVF